MTARARGDQTSLKLIQLTLLWGATAAPMVGERAGVVMAVVRFRLLEIRRQYLRRGWQVWLDASIESPCVRFGGKPH